MLFKYLMLFEEWIAYIRLMINYFQIITINRSLKMLLMREMEVVLGNFSSLIMIGLSY